MKHCTTHNNNKKSNDKNGFEKKEERALFEIKLVLTEKRREKKPAKTKTRCWRGSREESVHTVIHVRHFPDLPRGEIIIKVTSREKHCTTATSPRIKMG